MRDDSKSSESSSMASAKKALRASIAATLKALDSAEIERQSARLAERVCALPEFVGAAAVSVYLEMPKEAATTAVRAAAFAAGKKVYVPKITGRGAEDLVMVHASSMDDIRAFPKDKWQIPDPPLETATGAKRDDPIEALDLELVLLPGVAFDRSGGRLGHGKGYYDSFLRRLSEAYAANGKAPPRTIGLSLSPQLVEQVPLSPHDRMLDIIVTPDDVIRTGVNESVTSQ